MKFYIALATFVICAKVSAQLPSAAQALYDEAYEQDSLMVQYALNQDALVIPTPDSNSFYLQWFPENLAPAACPLIVSLHGSGGYAFHEFFNWHQLAQQYGCGIIALQWYRGDSASPPNDYFDETAIYTFIDSALSQLNYPSGKAFLHGFSRGAARSYAIILKDIQSGNNYFCTTLSNAGGADPSYPLYSEINQGIYGQTVFAGKRWALFCAGQDSNPAQSGCTGMSNTQTWLQLQGATVDLFIQDPNMQHDGFQQQQPPVYRDSVLNYYLQCYSGALSVNETAEFNTLQVFPNPASTSVNILFGTEIQNAEILLFNTYGERVKHINQYYGNQVILNTADLESGVYFVFINQPNGTSVTTKFIVDSNSRKP